jgi:hypothetical protein
VSKCRAIYASDVAVELAAALSECAIKAIKAIVASREAL